MSDRGAVPNPSPIDRMDAARFWSRLLRRGAEARVPVEAMIELTYGCNLRCVHCFNPTHLARNELAATQIKAIVDDLASLGCLSLGFTGGELLTRKDAFEIVEHAKRNGFAITLLTNATLMTPQRADRIQLLAPDVVEVSIYGASRQTYERVTRVPGSFTAFLNGMRLLLTRRVPIVLKMPVMTLNEHEVEQAQTLAEAWGVRFVYSTEITPRVDGSPEPLAYRLSPAAVLRVENRLRAAAEPPRDAEAPSSCRTLFSCKCGQSNLAVTPYGRMNLCVSFPTPQYDLRSGTVAEGWKTLVALVDATNATPDDAYECPACPVRRDCRQGPVDAWLATTTMASCVPYFKELATLGRERRSTCGHEPSPS